MKYYAHTKDNPLTKLPLPKEEWQLLIDHLRNVEKLTKENAAKFGASKLGEIIGLAHDIGKYSFEFQQRLDGSKARVDHSSAGAQELNEKYPGLGKALAYTVAGHHGGLPDGNKGELSNLPERLSNINIPEYKMYENEFNLPDLANEDLRDMPKAVKGMEAFSFSFCIRMLYSCLVDADYLDTEHTMNVEKSTLRPKKISMEILFSRLENKLKDLSEKNMMNSSNINNARQDILHRCLEMATSKPGFYTLTVPTGGGKTYSSLAFGMKHAVTYNKERIIYVIPYTSIIEQNADVFREALGYDNVVLEHHSNFEYPESDFNEWDDNEKVHRLAAENWDMPVITTTSVQFFESLFANKGSRCRKLHNMVNSVIILDEAQMIPIEYIKPCLWALAELVLNYQATVVFCTATQPALRSFIPGGLEITEIMDEPAELQKKFMRVNVSIAGSLKDDEIVEKMASVSQILTIVNTRKHARILFDKLINEKQEDIFHLSARMCPAHRKEVLAKIRSNLKLGKDCKVVSTQLIEAGVDVDFPIVMRSAAGIDSIAQAAGRCNREGKLSHGKVIIFDPESHGMPTKGSFEAEAAMTRSTIRRLSQFGGELLSLNAIDDYFKQLFELKEDELDSKKILKIISELGPEMAFPFVKISHEFQLIDSAMVPIIIPWNESALKLMDAAEHSPFPASKARSLQPYTVQVYQHELNGFEKEGVIKLVGGFMRFLTDDSFYDSQYGLKDAKEVVVPNEVYLF